MTRLTDPLKLDALKAATWLLAILFAFLWLHQWQARQEAERIADETQADAERMSHALAVCLNGGIPLCTEDSASIIVCNRATEVRL